MPNQITLNPSAQAGLDAIIRDATDVLRTQGIQIVAAGEVRLSSTASVGRIILRSATHKARAIEILLAHHIDAD